MRSSLIIAMVVGLALLVAVGSAYAQSPSIDGWGSAEQWPRAVELAAENQAPIVLLIYRFGNTEPQNQAARNWTSHRGLRGMIPIHVDRITDIPDGRDINAQVRESYRTGPRLFIVDPQLRVIGYRNYRHANQMNDAVNVATQIMRWQKTVETRLAAADAQAAEGRIGRALQAVDEIVRQDIQSTHAVALLAVSAGDGETATPPDPPEAGQFFPGLGEQKQAEYEALADQLVSEAEHLFQDLKLAEAARKLRPLASERQIDMPAVARARELQRQIREAQDALQRQEAARR